MHSKGFDRLIPHLVNEKGHREPYGEDDAQFYKWNYPKTEKGLHVSIKGITPSFTAILILSKAMKIELIEATQPLIRSEVHGMQPLSMAVRP
jgi:hypothetical protein